MKKGNDGWGECGRITEEGESGVKIREDLLGGAFANRTTHTYTHTGCNSLFNYM